MQARSVQIHLTGRTLGAAAAAAALAFGGVTPADDRAQLRQRIDQLEAEVVELRDRVRAVQAAQPAAAAPAYSAHDVDTAVSAVRADAARRAPPPLAGWTEQGFVLRSPDGNYSLTPGLQFQFRHDTNLGDFADGDSDMADGFEVRRMKVSFAGNAVTKDLTYFFLLGVDRTNGVPVIEEAWARHKLADRLFVRAGGIKTSASQETGISSRAQLAVDRSLLNDLILGGENFTQGVELQYEGNLVRAAIAWTDGFLSRNTTFEDVRGNFGVDARALFKPLGDWANAAEFSAQGTKRPLLILAAGETFTQDGDTNTIRYAVDALFKTGGGLSLYAGYVARLTSTATADTHDWGAIAQVGHMLGPRWEAYARYDLVKLADDAPNGEDTFHELTAGLNYYFNGQSLKFTLDAVYLPSGAPQNVTNIGVLGNNGENEFILRAQLQLLL